MKMFFFFDRQGNKRNYSTQISEMFFTFLREKLFEKNFSPWMFAKRHCKGRCKPQAAIKVGNFGAKLKHFHGFWLHVSFFSHEKNIVRNSYWTYHFFTCENHFSLLWLARAHLPMKTYDIAFWWVFLSMYLTYFFYIILF